MISIESSASLKRSRVSFKLISITKPVGNLPSTGYLDKGMRKVLAGGKEINSSPSSSSSTFLLPMISLCFPLIF